MKKNAASQIIGAQMVDASTGAAFTGAVTVYVTGDGGTQAVGSVGSGACTHEGNGFHTYAPAQAETNYDHVAFTFIGTGAVPATVQVYTSFPQTGDNFARLGAPAGASLSADVLALAGYVDTEVAAIKTKTDFLPSATAGASGGLLISGSNAGTTTLGALTVTGATTLTGNVALADGLTIAAPSTANRAGVTVAGNGTGAGIVSTGGATGSGLRLIGGSTSGHGIHTSTTSGTGAFLSAGGGNQAGLALSGNGTGAGLNCAGGATGQGINAVGGATSGDGIRVTTTSGHGLNLAPAGTNMHGLFATGGNGGTSDGFRAVAGTGGVPIRGSITGDITGNLSGSVGSVTAIAANAITAAALAADAGTEIGTAVWAAATRELTSGANIVLAKGAGVTGFNDLSAAQVNAEADTAIADAALATAANLAVVAGYLDTEIGAIKAKTDNLPAAPAAVGDIPTAAAVADAVWDESIAGHADVGSTGAALAAAGGSGDPWATALPGAYGAGTAGKIVGDYIDAAISSMATQASVDDLPTNAELATALAAADDAVLSAIGALSIPTATQNADALLNRDMSAVSDTNARSPLNALRHIRNKWDTTTNAGFVTVFKENDSTEAWRAALATDGAAQPITGSDPT